MERTFFISHVTDADGAAAARLAERLEAEGASAWLAPRDIPAGAQYSVSIGDAIESCSAIVVLLSLATAGSAAVANEVEIAVGRLHKPVYLVRLANIAPPKSIALHVSTVQWLDAFTSMEDAARVLVRGGGVRRRPSPRYQIQPRTVWPVVGLGALAAMAVTALIFARESPPQHTAAEPRTQAPRVATHVEPSAPSAQTIQPFDQLPARTEQSAEEQREPPNPSTLDFSEEPTR